MGEENTALNMFDAFENCRKQFQRFEWSDRFLILRMLDWHFKREEEKEFLSANRAAQGTDNVAQFVPRER